MTTQTPPKLPNPSVAWRVYLGAFATILPDLIILNFANIFLVPKLEQIWSDAGLTNSRVQWLLDGSRFLTFPFPLEFVLTGFFLAVLALERYPTWSRYRRPVVVTGAVIFHIAVLVGITAFATAALLAAPLSAKKKAAIIPKSHVDLPSVNVDQGGK